MSLKTIVIYMEIMKEMSEPLFPLSVALVRGLAFVAAVMERGRLNISIILQREHGQCVIVLPVVALEFVKDVMEMEV